MELDPPESLWLHVRGCGISGTRARVDFPAPHLMYLRRGWKTFSHIHRLTEGLTLHFKLMEGGLLSVKGLRALRNPCKVLRGELF